MTAIALSACGEPLPSASPAPTPAPTAPSRSDAWQHVNPDAPDQVILGRVLFWEDFENGLSRWRIEGAAGAARWLLLEGNFCGGAFTMLFGLPERAEFAGGTGQSTLTLQEPIDLSTATRPHLKYDVRGLSYPQDALMVQPEARTPGGDWQPVGPVTVSRYPSDMGYRAADLTPYAGGKVEVRFKAYLSPLERPTRGFMLDDVKILEPSS